MRTLGLDPGDSTGWALFDGEKRIDGGVIINGLEGFIEWAKADMPQHDVLVVEAFVVQPSFVGTPTAAEVLGAAWTLSGAKQKVRQLRSKKATVIAGTEAEKKLEPIRNLEPKVGRNDPCPCGSGKKYKSCCMRR